MTFLSSLALAMSLAWQPPRIDDGSHVPIPRTQPAPAREEPRDMRPFYVGAVVVATVALLLWNRRRKLELEREYERDRERAKRGADGADPDPDADDLREAALRSSGDGDAKEKE
jgi:hypothetical protein